MVENTEVSSFDFKSFLRNLSTQPGVYRMLDKHAQIIYVGKARNLRARLSSYAGKQLSSAKTRALVAQIDSIELTITPTEADALLLENQLIKAHRPRYNVLLRDDKSYPYIYLSDGEFPRLDFHRGARRGKGQYFGPYPSAGSVRQTLQLLQKVFRVRQCEDSFFRNRSRPCLQYQIQRCTAPCVGLIDSEDYAADVRFTRLFLQGQDDQVVDELVRRMEQAAERLEFERAADYRDQVAGLQQIRERQFAESVAGNVDVLACSTRSGAACVQLFMIRQGRRLGNRAFYPRAPALAAPGEILYEVIGQYYSAHPPPTEILLSHAVDDADWLASMLSQRAGHAVRLQHRPRGPRAQWVRTAQENADLALNTHLASRAGVGERFLALQQLFELDDVPERIECFDVSHTGGEAAVASCVVFSRESGPVSGDYRRFNLEGITPGDDYAGMEQVLSRRYSRILRENRRMPDVILVDGGKGQLQRARRVLTEMQINGALLVGVAKGADRKAGLETLWVAGRRQPVVPSPDSPALHLIQQIRDEAHRFAIIGHRKRRAARRQISDLESIPNLGPKRRQQLLKHLGGARGVQRAGIEDLKRVPGISLKLAESIFAHLHGQAGTGGDE